MIYLQLYWEFFKTGLFAVGGGMATVPFLNEIGIRTGWYSPAMLADMIAVSESTPGPIGVNMATFVGYTVGGIPGAVITTLGIISPCIIIILIIAAFLNAFRSNPTVDRVFYGIRPASTALIASAGIGVMRLCLLDEAAWAATGRITSLFHLPEILLMAAIWCLTNLVRQTKKLHPLVFIALSAVVGIVFSL
ncbi:MAG: chromate transporter [Oscillospiraceae bacterium]|nr:chromate transporter [Oscillospiraceae bacterium]